MADRDRTLGMELSSLGRLIPTGRRVLVVGRDGAALAEGLGAAASRFDPSTFEGSDPLASVRSARPEVAALVGGIASCEAFPSLFEFFADNCIPIFYVPDPVDTGHESALGRLIEKCFEVLRFPRHAMDVCVAIPRSCLTEPAWLPPYIRQLRIRLERKQSKLEANAVVPGGGKTFGNSWHKRDQIVAGWVPTNLRIADVGCGAMTAEKILLPRAYLPIDLERRDERTRVLDLNVAEIPVSWLENVDLVLFLGVLEYVDQPLKHLQQVASLSKPIVVSYHVFERRSRLRQMTAGQWRSVLRDDDLRQAFATYRYDVESYIAIGSQSIYLVKSRDASTLWPET